MASNAYKMNNYQWTVREYRCCRPWQWQEFTGLAVDKGRGAL
jgi:hypothetical protein